MPSAPSKAGNFVPQVRSVTLCDYIRVCRSVGLEPYAMLREFGIDPRVLDVPETRLPAVAVTRLLEESARRSGTESFGLLLAEARPFASLGPLSLLLRHEGSLRNVIGRMIEYRRLMSDVQELQLREDDTEAALHVGIMAAVSGRQAVELALGLTERFVNQALSGGWRPSSVHFTHGAPADLAVHRRIFRCPLRFASDFQGFRFPAASLDKENAFADAGLVQHAKDHVDLLASELPRLSLLDQVREMIAMLLPKGAASLSKVSHQLQLHPRALQRSLAKDGLAFTDLVDAIRQDLAQDLLARTELPISEVAHLAGYSTAASFSRWFTERTSVPPSEWRLRHGGAAG
jgi:AraC-like DNA-binding protein